MLPLPDYNARLIRPLGLLVHKNGTFTVSIQLKLDRTLWNARFESMSNSSVMICRGVPRVSRDDQRHRGSQRKTVDTFGHQMLHVRYI